LLTLLIAAAAPAAFEPQPLIPGSPYVLPGHQETLTAIAFSPDSKKLASAGRDKNVKVWSLETGKELGSFKVGVQQINALGWSGDGKKLVVGDSALSVQVIDAETGKVLEQLAHPDTISQLALQPDGAAVAVTGVTDVGAVYELPGGKKRFEFRGRTTQYSADGKLLLVASNTGKFELLDAKTGKAKLTVPTPGELPMTAMTPDAKLVATWSTAGVDVKLWSADGKPVGVIKGPPFDLGSRKPTVNGAVPLRDGKRVVVAGADGILRLYKVGTDGAVQRWPADRNQSLVVSADETWLAVIDATVIKLWKLPQ
jgi:WD40 repeat protein